MKRICVARAARVLDRDDIDVEPRCCGEVREVIRIRRQNPVAVVCEQHHRRVDDIVAPSASEQGACASSKRLVKRLDLWDLTLSFVVTR